MWPEAEQTGKFLKAAEQGDSSARDQLLERHRESVKRMIELRMDRRLLQRVDASDIVQDVLLEAHRRLAAYFENPGMPFHLWLRQLAQDRIIDMHRRHRVAQRRSLDREQPLSPQWVEHSSLNLGVQLQDTQLTPAAENLRREMTGLLLSAIDQLDETDREIILMRHFEQLDNQEVAKLLGLSPAAAGMRHLRALRRLKEYLNPSAGAEE
ncbi:RNA polymerase sigma factor CnrH [Polystyrenella longa]|uniref:RNA polymerase sigma factor CnrH n=1 Tax=Polystyrenella longa TaxID=2528007 RepID=A0A518CQE8_9PLAN|nr:sigma-70 family RNA polymerase sigma factor [Polystyrenella longa]QDU81457.1 RNA polymerase sigma factor CnrH [Polystyrenella longa]